MKYITTILYLTFFTFNVFGHDGEKGFEFSKNKGQWPSNVLYHTKLLQGGIFFEKNKITFDLINSNQLNELFNIKHNGPLSETSTSGNPIISPRGLTNKKDSLKRNAYSMSFVGANESSLIHASGKLGKQLNYAIGDDESKWSSNVPVFRQIEYQNLYEGIDMQFYSTVKNLKYDFIVSAGANASDILIEYDGVKNISLDHEGSLIIQLEDDEVREYRPLSYQIINGKQVIVPSKFVIENKSVRFIFPNGYDSSQELIIDPVIIFSTVVGSTADNWGFTATYDVLGNLYAAGIAFGSGYPTTIGSFAGGSFDISVTKWDSTGSSILYSTYIGGLVDDEMPNSLVTNSNNELIILGSSSSSDYPTTGSAYDQNFNSGTGIYVNMWGSVYAAGCDVVLTKLGATGAILESTFIGGSDNEGMNESLVYNYADQGRGEVVLDAADNIYVCTSGWSTDFPGAIVPNSGSQDAIVFKMNSDLSGLLWSTYYGGSGSDAGYSIRLNSLGEIYICGGTVSTNLNKSPGGLLTSSQGSWDGFLARFNGATGALLSDTYIGTSSYDQTFILEIDQSNDVYMIGQTLGNYAVINAPYSNADSPQFIHKLTADLTTTIYSTVFGNGSLAPGGFANEINIAPTAFLVDDCGNVYVSGWGGGSNSWNYNPPGVVVPFDPQAGGTVASMPITNTGTEQTTTDNSDFYFFVMERDAQGLLYASYFGDPVALEHTDGGTSRFDPKGIVYQSVCATCGSGSFPSNNALFPGNPANDVCNLGVLKFKFDFQGVEASATVPANITLCSTDYTVSFTSSGSSPQQEWIFGDGGTSSSANPTYTYSDTGSYVVAFIAIDPASCNIRDTAYFNVDIEQAPTFDASFNLPVIPPCSDPASVTVNATITGIGIDSTEWNMGDGTIYTDLTTIAHDYITEGIYPIEVIAWDLTCNISDTIYDTLNFITAISTATANAPADTTLCSNPPFAIPFTSDGSTPNVFWDFGDGNTSIAQNPINTFTAAGTYTVQFIAIDSSTCNIADTVPFTVELIQAPTFSASFNIPVIPPCSDPSSVTVDADISGTGIDSTQWNMGDGTIFADSTSISYSYTTQGIYPIEVIAWDLTCNVSDTIYDTLHFISTFSTATANAPADTTLCSNPPFAIPFTSDGSTPYVSWDFGDGNTSTAQNPTNTFAAAGTYTVEFIAIDSNTCNIADTVPFIVELIQAPTFSASFNLPIIPPCADPDSVMVNIDISGTGIDSTHWDMGDGTTFQDSTSISYSYASTGIYDITITAWDYCGGDTNIFETFNFITDSSLAVAAAPEDTTLCTFPPFSIDFTSSGTTASQFWDFGDGNTSIEVNPTNTFLDSGTYIVTYIAIDSSTCNIADTAYFNVNLIQAEQFSAEINFTPPPPCGGDSMLVELAFSGTAADSLIWDMGNGDVFYADSIAYYYTEAGIYNLSLTAFDFTCNLMEVISSEVPFFGNISTDVIIPNVFTPNGDGQNDLLTFVNVNGSEAFRLTVWNRWGKKVFVTDDPFNHWDGISMKDKKINEGVYYFEVLFTDVCSDEEQIKTGFVHLMR